ncbi:MAG TPA: hypothetical protein VFG10_00520 [Saprospiraceae bacterium]|nr:hypothetical protein [Saprospiraceae bacterium]
MFHLRWPRGKGDAIERTCGEKFAEFAPSFCVAGDAGVEIASIEPVFDAEDGLDVAFFAFFDPLDSAGGVVNIGEGEGGDATTGGSFGQVLGGERAVFEGVVGVAVEIHGKVKIREMTYF